MSTIRLDKWQRTDGSTVGFVVNSTMVTVPNTYGGSSGGGYLLLSNCTRSNTAGLFNFSYTPVSQSSTVYYKCFLDVDRDSSSNYEMLVMFANGTPNAASYCYPRVQGNEERQHCFAGSVVATGGTIQFELRVNSTWGCFLGKSNGGYNAISNTIQIFEVQR
jgi:hypothetical protein